jgi:hypothetical protein
MSAIGVVAALLLAGCAMIYPAAEQPLAVDAVIADAVAAARAPQSEQKAALARAQQAHAQSQEPLNRLRLAALLATLPPPQRDDARAAELLDPLVDAASPGIGRFAALLAMQIAERQRFNRDLERAGREADRLAKDRERADRERSLADKERDKREEALRQQLDALRSIERGILEREDKLRRKPR